MQISLNSSLSKLAAMATIVGAAVALMDYLGSKDHEDQPLTSVYGPPSSITSNQNSTASSVAGPGGASSAISNISNSYTVNQIDNRVNAGDGAVVIIQRGK
tara:strand:- start:155 stop:457 length:303 start_codon:yes stop_codon:yes gene_type:complete